MGPGIGDYQALLGVIADLHSALTPGELCQAIREGLARLVPGDCHDFVLFAGSVTSDDMFCSQPGTYTEGEMLFMLENFAKHPLMAVFDRGDPGALCVSQVIPTRRWWNSEFYHESGYRRLGLRHELSALVPEVSRTSLAAVSVLRGREFSARDREIIDHLRPHIGLAWSRAAAARATFSPAMVRRVFPQLSEREAEVLFWIVEGKQNREIAEILMLRLNTIQEHVENIVRKLGMENRHATAVFTLRTLMSGGGGGGQEGRLAG